MAKFGVPTEAQLAKINRLAKRTLSADEVFAFSGKSAGDMMIPGRYMRLSPELLKVMADDANKGVSFMYNHSWSQWNSKGVPYGKVFEGLTQASDKENETTELHLSRYIVHDDEVMDGISANALIKRIETGVLSDTSIGWGTDTMMCSICAKSYYSRECSHYRGAKYEMGDGTQKVCTVTAMPPSVIIPYNNNALFEESIVWDGAYPGAVVTQSKSGDIIELPTGSFAVVGEKEEFPDNTLFHGYYHNGDILTMVKKSDHKKINPVTMKKEGDENQMNEKVTQMLEKLGIVFKEGETKLEDVLSQMAEKQETLKKTIEEFAEPLKPAEEQLLSTEFIGIPVKEITETFGAELSVDKVLSLAKEGQEYKKQLIDDALAMGVRAMSNEFTKETWEQTFASMGTKSIKDIMKTWEKQANDVIPTGRQTDPAAGQQKQATAPDEAYRVGR